MFRLTALLGLIGLAVATALIVWSGWSQVVDALAQAGWGIAAVALFHTIPLILSAISWQILIPGRTRPSLLQFIYFLWIRASVNNLMPVARIGGEIAAIRVMIAHGMRRNVAISSTVVELTMSVLAIFTFVVTGVILFAARFSDRGLSGKLLGGLLFSLAAIAALLVVQRIGFFGLAARVFRALFRDKWIQISGNGAALDRAISTMYRRRSRVIACGALQLVAWSLGSVEIALTLFFVGHPLPFIDDVMLEALIQGSASAAFVVPGALGVQEAGFLLFGGMLGLPHQYAAALAVVRRCRDLICYAPGLIAWQAHEGKKLLRS